MLRELYDECVRIAAASSRNAQIARDVAHAVMVEVIARGQAEMLERRGWVFNAVRKRVAFEARTAARRSARETQWSTEMSGAGPRRSTEMSGAGQRRSTEVSGAGPRRSTEMSGAGPRRSTEMSGAGPRRSTEMSKPWGSTGDESREQQASVRDGAEPWRFSTALLARLSPALRVIAALASADLAPREIRWVLRLSDTAFRKRASDLARAVREAREQGVELVERADAAYALGERRAEILATLRPDCVVASHDPDGHSIVFSRTGSPDGVSGRAAIARPVAFRAHESAGDGNEES